MARKFINPQSILSSPLTFLMNIKEITYPFLLKIMISYD